jgi:hypothetical protein
MSKTALTTILVTAATLVYAALALTSGRTSLNGGLGPDGPIYAAMAVNHDLRAGSAVDKLMPAFPLAAAIAYAVTGNVTLSFLLVNVVALAVLVWAMCWIFDLESAPPSVKVYATITLLLLGIPTRTSAFDPGQAQVLGLAAISLAVAASEWAAGVVTAILQVGAVLASPIGIIAPLYGIWRHWRRASTAQVLAAFVPALLVWLLVQYFARGGSAGLVDLLRFSRVRADAAFWTESLFILFGLYFLLTAFGGLSVLLIAHRSWSRNTISRRPELLALALPVALFIATAGLDVPRTAAFLLPFWFVVLGVWARDHAASITMPLVLATVITVLTQHPWVKLTDTTYFVDWFPYSVYAGRVNVSKAGFDALWRLRMFFAAGGLAACAAWRRSRAQLRDAGI